MGYLVVEQQMWVPLMASSPTETVVIDCIPGKEVDVFELPTSICDSRITWCGRFDDPQNQQICIHFRENNGSEISSCRF